MSRKCSSCNAVVEDNMKICPNCGRLLSSIGDRHEYQPHKPQPAKPAAKRPQAARPQHSVSRAGGSRQGSVQHRQPPKGQPAKARTAAKGHSSPAHEKNELPRWTMIVRRTALMLLIAAAVYFMLFGLQVLRIRHSTYEFDTKMKLSSGSFGEAFDSSVQDGGWSYNPFTFTMTYSGRHDGRDMKVRFSAGFSVDVKSVTVGEEEKTTKEQINNYLMGLFI